MLFILFCPTEFTFSLVYSEDRGNSFLSLGVFRTHLDKLKISKESISTLRKNELYGGTFGTWTNNNEEFPGGSSHAIVVCFTGCQTNCQ